MTDYKALLTGYPIHIATKEIQRRKHHKKRINKKWKKRYGIIELNSMPHGKVVMMDNGVIWMTKRTFESLRKSTGRKERGMKKEVYVCNSGSYSMAIKLSKSQAAAIKWFIDKFLDESSKYDCVLAEEYAEEVEE